MKVVEILSQAREAVLEIRRIEEQAEVRRSEIGVQGHDYGAHGKNGVLDPMRKVDDLLDWQNDHIERSGLMELIDEAQEIIDGIAEIADDATVEAVTRYYLQAEPWDEIAHDMARHNKSLSKMKPSILVKCLRQAVSTSIQGCEQIGVAKLKKLGNR